MRIDDLRDILFDADYHTGIALVTLNQPKRNNGLTHLTSLELWWAVDIFQKDERLHAMVITGARREQGYDPEREAFCSGGYFVASLMDGISEELKAQIDEQDIAHKKLTLKFWQCDKPVIAAINGLAIGMGATLPIACADLIYISEHAWMQFPFVRLGIQPELASTFLLPRRMGFQRAKEILFSGRKITASQAVNLGLANEVAPHEKLLRQATIAAQKLIPPDGAALAVRMTKRALHMPLIAQISTALDIENQGLNRTMTSVDFAEGVAARSQKRDPVFKGR